MKFVGAASCPDYVAIAKVRKNKGVIECEQCRVGKKRSKS